MMLTVGILNVVTEQGLIGSQYHRKYFDNYPSSCVETDPRTACNENPSYFCFFVTSWGGDEAYR